MSSAALMTQPARLPEHYLVLFQLLTSELQKTEGFWAGWQAPCNLGKWMFMLKEANVSGVIRRICAFGLMLLSLGWAGVRCAQADSAERQPRIKSEPVYPDLARKMHIVGTVKISVTIAPTGIVKSTKVIGGNPVLVEAALAAVKKWRFESAPEETTQVVEFRFNAQ
jgi:TonB family protein